LHIASYSRPFCSAKDSTPFATRQSLRIAKARSLTSSYCTEQRFLINTRTALAVLLQLFFDVTAKKAAAS
jgi:hypothetical protein